MITLPLQFVSQMEHVITIITRYCMWQRRRQWQRPRDSWHAAFFSFESCNALMRSGALVLRAWSWMEAVSTPSRSIFDPMRRQSMGMHFKSKSHTFTVAKQDECDKWWLRCANHFTSCFFNKKHTSHYNFQCLHRKTKTPWPAFKFLFRGGCTRILT